ncbi:unnamed protein product [Trichogramma brassicae]|uniref:Uncharacterized protein n=1 Tax=Trichogramma brassicae TaxID=86971 RepID=A0A6H5IIK3_9HYME|nr:unnamed protein product [Trichogramma brassicae]
MFYRYCVYTNEPRCCEREEHECVSQRKNCFPTSRLILVVYENYSSSYKTSNGKLARRCEVIGQRFLGNESHVEHFKLLERSPTYFLIGARHTTNDKKKGEKKGYAESLTGHSLDCSACAFLIVVVATTAAAAVASAAAAETSIYSSDNGAWRGGRAPRALQAFASVVHINVRRDYKSRRCASYHGVYIIHTHTCSCEREYSYTRACCFARIYRYRSRDHAKFMLARCLTRYFDTEKSYPRDRFSRETYFVARSERDT